MSFLYALNLIERMMNGTFSPALKCLHTWGAPIRGVLAGTSLSWGLLLMLSKIMTGCCAAVCSYHHVQTCPALWQRL